MEANPVVSQAPQPIADGTMPSPSTVIFDDGLGSGWSDYGWAVEVPASGAAVISLHDYGGWILVNGEIRGRFTPLPKQASPRST